MTGLIALAVACPPFSMAQVVWQEDFTGQVGKGITGGDPPVTNMAGITKWTVETTTSLGSNEQFAVSSNATLGLFFESISVDDECIWQTEMVDISTTEAVEVTIDLSEVGTMESSDYIRAYYSLDGQAETLFAENGDMTDDFTSAVAKQEALIGTNVVIVIRTDNNSNTEKHRFDNVVVTATALVSNVPPSLALNPEGSNKFGTVGSELAFDVIATEPFLDLADAITLRTNSGPADATFGEVVGTSPLTNGFSWTPSAAGDYTVVFAGVDKDGTNTLQVDITVTALDPSKIWINEIHYDNLSTDVDEGFEIAGPAGISVDDYYVYSYEGSGGSEGTVQGQQALSGVIDNEGVSAFGALWFDYPSLENGPDGLALVKVVGGATSILQFISYEGSFLAIEGPAAGITSEDIGVFETTSTPTNYSLQLVGAGKTYSDFIWTGPTNHSRGWINAGQTLQAFGTLLFVK